MAASGKIASVSKECVACGTCMKACPRGAVTVYKGVCAVVEKDRCAGCGVCAKACPGNIISVILRGDVS